MVTPPSHPIPSLSHFTSTFSSTPTPQSCTQSTQTRLALSLRDITPRSEVAIAQHDCISKNCISKNLKNSLEIGIDEGKNIAYVKCGKCASKYDTLVTGECDA